MNQRTSQQGTRELIGGYLDGRLSRRDFVRGGLALGLSMSSIGGLLAACTNQSSSSQATTPKKGGTLREGYDLDFSRLDPINTNWYDPAFYAVYEAVVTNDRQGNYVPQIAEKWTVSSDSKTVTFKIRSGLKFHSGAPLTASAIKAVYDGIADPKNGSPLASVWNPVQTTQAPDDTTLVINLKHPYFDLFNVIKTGYWDIINMDTRAKLGDKYGQQGVDGSGPFTLSEWVPGSHTTVKRWDGYPGTVTPFIQNKGKPYLDSINWVAILEAPQRAIQIQNGEIDTLRGPAFQDITRLEADKNLTVTKLKEWSGYFFSTNFARTDLGFDDVNVRQALSHAIDRQSIVKALLFGHGEPLHGPITTADKSYTKDVEQFNQFDVNKAKSMLATAGWKAGSDGILTKNGVRFQFEMIIQAESFNQQLGSVIQAQLKAVGVDLKVSSLDRGTFFNRAFANPDSVMFFYLWPVPIDVVTLFVNSVNAHGKGPNWSNASVPQVDAAIAAWQSAADQGQLNAAGKQFQLAVAQHLPFVPIINRDAFWVHRQNVHGWQPDQWNLYPYYNDVWIG
jgi:peptide/nickel transport system substrate-binding protein